MKSSSNVTINTKVWDKLKARIPDIADHRVHVGVLAEGGGTATIPGSDITMIELAAIHEFGSPAAGIPQRSFLVSTFDRPSVDKGIRALASRYAGAIVAGKMTVDVALGRIGAFAVAKIRETIKNRLTVGDGDQANAPSTIASKGSDLPLVDTGRLINAITWVIRRATGGDA